ncbi:hypothetical protein JHK87_047464 [Glycine soja]|nr:hypothetical protein JHK87_047464 [Glycine soja]
MSSPLNVLGMIISMTHLTMKFPNLKGDIITIRVNQMENHECYARSLLVKPCTFTSEKHPRAVDIKNTGGTDSRRDEEDKLVTPSWVNFDPQLEVSPDSVHPHVGPLLVFARERVETRRYVDLITTFDQGKLSRSFTIKYLLVDPNTSYFALIGRKMLNTEILTIKVDQKQARHYYAKSLKVAPYPPIWKLTMPYPIAAEGTQVMTVDKGSQIRALTICNMGKKFDIDPRDDTSDRGPKPIEELVQLQLGPKPR